MSINFDCKERIEIERETTDCDWGMRKSQKHSKSFKDSI